MSRSLEKLTSLLLLSYNMKTSLICCMNGNRTIEVLVSQCKTVFSPLFPFQLSGKLHRLSSFPALLQQCRLSYLGCRVFNLDIRDVSNILNEKDSSWSRLPAPHFCHSSTLFGKWVFFCRLFQLLALLFSNLQIVGLAKSGTFQKNQILHK